MAAFELLGGGFLAAFQFWAFMTIVTGLLVGVVAGALPGISFVNAMAMALPFTYVMEPTQSMLFLGGIYVGGVFGGSISAILINVPGTPASLPATWDGYPMTKRGEAKRALTIAVTASAIGGLVSALVLAFLSAPFASFALKFSQPEFFAATLLGLVSVIAIAKDQPVITMVSLLLGIVVGTVGVDPLYGQARFSFGVPEMESGIRFVVVMIGLFAIGEVIDLLATDRDLRPKKTGGKAVGAKLRDILDVKWAIARGTGIGCLIGMIPGAGATPGAVIAYGIEKQVSKRGSAFGTGVEEGLAAPEAAKNATTGAAMMRRAGRRRACAAPTAACGAWVNAAAAAAPAPRSLESAPRRATSPVGARRPAPRPRPAPARARSGRVMSLAPAGETRSRHRSR